jgi:P27 family predicted phage terminase small subunit
MSEKQRNVPLHLSKRAKELWSQLVDEYDLDDSAAQLLVSALEEFDKCEDAKKTLLKEGNFIRDRFNQRKAHPALAVVRDSRATMLRFFKALNLDLEPLRDSVGRPPGTSRPIGE